jgi:hypothetical protein
VSLIPTARITCFSSLAPQTIENAQQKNAFFGAAHAFTDTKGPLAGASREKKLSPGWRAPKFCEERE